MLTQPPTDSDNLYGSSQTDRHRYATVKIREMTTNIRLPRICRRVLLIEREVPREGGWERKILRDLRSYQLNQIGPQAAMNFVQQITQIMAIHCYLLNRATFAVRFSS